MSENKIRLENSSIHTVCNKEKKEMAWTVFTWAIPNFTNLREDVVYYRKARTLTQKWVLKLQKTTRILFLKLYSSDAVEFVNFTILGRCNQTLNSGITSDFVDGEYISEFQIDTISYDFLVDDCLTVECKHVEKHMNTFADSYKLDQACKESRGAGIRQDFKKLLFVGICSDFTIHVGSAKYYLHKPILAARSEYFAEMFAPGAALEKETEMTYDSTNFAFREVLIYVYSGEFRKMSVEATEEVIKIAVEFGIKRLAYWCLNSLSMNLNKDNVLGILAVACKLNYKDLKNTVVRFMSTNCPELMKTDEFRAALKLVKK